MVIFGNEKIEQMDSFTYLCGVISKDSGCREDIKNRIVKTWGIFLKLRKVKSTVRQWQSMVLKHRHSENEAGFAREFPKKLPTDRFDYLTD